VAATSRWLQYEAATGGQSKLTISVLSLKVEVTSRSPLWRKRATFFGLGENETCGAKLNNLWRNLKFETLLLHIWEGLMFLLRYWLSCFGNVLEFIASCSEYWNYTYWGSLLLFPSKYVIQGKTSFRNFSKSAYTENIQLTLQINYKKEVLGLIHETRCLFKMCKCLPLKFNVLL
jgi:hypothetical protein